MTDAAPGAAPPPQFSIVVPTYNRRGPVLRAIDSALAQDGAESREIVVVDDGSADATLAALGERYAGNAAVRVLAAPHRGPSAARNLGFEASRGAWVCFLDSDDRLLPHALRRVGEVTRRFPELAFLSLEGRAEGGTRPAGTRIVQANPGWLGPGRAATAVATHGIGAAPDGGAVPLLTAQWLRAVLDGDLFFLSGLFMRREAARNAGPFDPRYRLLEDWDFHARLCLHGPGGLLDEVGFVRRVGGADQLSARLTPLRRALMHARIARNAGRHPAAGAGGNRRIVRRAERDARYWLGRELLGCARRRLGRRLLAASLLQGYKPAKCAYLLAGLPFISS